MSPDESTASSAAPKTSSPSSEKAPDATAKGIDVSVKAPKLADASTAKAVDLNLNKTSVNPATAQVNISPKSASDATDSAKDMAPKSVNVTLSKAAPPSTSDASHKVAEVSNSTSAAGPDAASPKKVQVNIGKAANEDKSPEGSSPDVKKVEASVGSTGIDVTTSKKIDSHSIKPMDDPFHDTEDSHDLDPKKQEKSKSKDTEPGPPNPLLSQESPAVLAKVNIIA
jgi:hypothetical protein